MRVLGVDHGQKRIGLAITDELGITSRGLCVLTTEGKTSKDLLQCFRELVQAERVTEIVVGLPRNMDGTIGPRAEEVLQFIAELKQGVDVPIATVDERLTSKEADAILRRNTRKNRARGDRSERDMVAAQIILRDYLAEQGSM